MCKRLLVPTAFVLLIAMATPGSGKLAGWWKLDESGGGVAGDSSGNGYDGAVNGTAKWVTGKVSGALQFDGTSTYVNCGVIPVATNGTGGLSVAVWVNRSAAGDHKLCSNRQVDSGAGGGFTCAIYNNRMEMDLEDASGRTLSRDSARPTLPGVGEWVHLIWILDDQADTLKLYVNGALSAKATVTRSIGLSTQFFRIGSDSPNLGHYFAGMVDDLRIYDSALSESNINPWPPQIAPQAINPEPANKQADVRRDVTLGWTPDASIATHDVYFGTNADDVNLAGRTDPRGALVSLAQDANTYDPQGLLALDQTYYWRVDEVNGAPDFTVFKGRVWSFAGEPTVYKLSNITATASSSWSANTGPEKTIDGSGLNGQDQHGMDSSTMWTSAGESNPWIQYRFDRVYSLHQMWVWNSNQSVEWILGMGIKSVRVEYSTDGQSWTALTDVTEFAQAPSTEGYAHDTTVDFHGAPAQFVRITPLSSWSGRTQCGLSEVRFHYTPVFAREPSPAHNQTGVYPAATLSWRAGRNAVSHKVYTGADPNALSLAATTTETRYAPAPVNLGTTRYWRIDEVNEADAISVWTGDIWKFTAAEFVVVDDMESYTDQAPSRIFDVWIDGYGNPTANGATVGYDLGVNGTFCETTLVHGGRQSMPFRYRNLAATTHSEAERTWSTAQNWTLHGADALSLCFRGDPNTNTPDTLYITVTDADGHSATVRHPDASALTVAQWQPWTIPFSSLGTVNAGRIKAMIIGIGDRTNPWHGSGTLLIDDIRLIHEADQ